LLGTKGYVVVVVASSTLPVVLVPGPASHSFVPVVAVPPGTKFDLLPGSQKALL
jgi:hypothetical protein